MKKKIILLLTGGLLIAGLSTQVLAAGIVLKIADNGLRNTANAAMDPTYSGPGSVDTANIEFFSGSVPVNANSTVGRISIMNYSHPGIHQYDTTTNVGGTVTIRSWDGAPRTLGSHYGISRGYTAATGTSATAIQHTVDAFRTIYLAGVPVNAPRINSVTESNQRVGDTTDVVLDLALNWTGTYSQGSEPNLIVATGYDLKYWIGTAAEPADADPNRVVSVAGTSWSLPDVDPVTRAPFNAGTYHFRVRAKNVFGPGPWSDPVYDWTTLSGGIGGPETVTYNFRRPSGDLGLNPISFPFANVSGVTTLRQLIESINTQAGSNVVTSAGWWDVAAQQPVGYIVTYTSGDLNSFSFITAGGAPADPADVTMGKDQTYQISVLADAVAELTGTR
ncbi:MAG: fibronectin type III domain-containing protein [Candidatus Saganbacteria bacterium]|nr:fibronectin type III domain-containing protein [Candidatus Saganbacteria bacterium]